jgi:hypothetical protein
LKLLLDTLSVSDAGQSQSARGINVAGLQWLANGFADFTVA